LFIVQAHGHAQFTQIAVGAGCFDGLKIHGLLATAQTDTEWRVALVIDLVVEDEMDQIVAALALRSLDFHQGQGDCLGHIAYIRSKHALLPILGMIFRI
jgi:hypothetical protein